MMDNEPKKKNEKPSSNYQEEIPKGKVPEGEKAVKKAEDLNYTQEEAEFKNMAKRKENGEQPVDPIKTPPTKD
ncbi:hypothetical protein AAKU52_003289 [Pedobacter sp. CG_S7]|uniref:hypothetical protein n=1 Tax=Pedobacter sp. CG_S7 TaxID=3143930 RepID=UPI003399B4BE